MSHQAKPYQSYIVHVSHDCPWCTRAQALLDYYKSEYEVRTDKCEDWPTWPAIYGVSESRTDLIGGYDQLISLSYESGL